MVDRPSKEISRILSALERHDGTYPREALDAALAHRKEITPYLIAILEQVRDDPDKFLDDPGDMAPTYALELLAYFQERRAHEVIVDLCSLPPEVPHGLFGDIVTEDMPAIMLATCGGSVERIVALLRNREADEYCRSAAARALAFAVAEGVVPREDVIALFGSLFTGTEAGDESDFWSFLAISVWDLYPAELMDVIRAAYDRGMISEEVIDLDSFEEALDTGSKAAAYAKIKAKRKHHMPPDFHKRTEWWSMFHDDEDA